MDTAQLTIEKYRDYKNFLPAEKYLKKKIKKFFFKIFIKLLIQLKFRKMYKLLKKRLILKS